jgi:hypothetical protein
LEVADVIRACGVDFLRQYGSILSNEQRRVLDDLVKCRTTALGGHKERCQACGHERITYNSCRNRHCPKCQGSAQAAWLAREQQSLLPVQYFHVVFTLPQEIADLALQNRQVLYDLLFRAASQTLQEVAADPKHLGAQLGVLMVLHTWGQNLHHHPHVHCVVTGGGLSCDAKGRVDAEAHWVSCRPGFFLPVRVLSRVFRGKYLTLLQEAYQRGELSCHGLLSGLASAEAFTAWLKPLYGKDWVVYAKEPFAGPEVVLKYLARYTHRVAISNRRLQSLANGQVSFTWKDYAHGGKEKVITMTGVEFLRRFLLHVLPKGFVKIRHYGLLANGKRVAKLTVCRILLALLSSVLKLVVPLLASAEDPGKTSACPSCGCLNWLVVERLPSEREQRKRGLVDDTS